MIYYLQKEIINVKYVFILKEICYETSENYSGRSAAF